MNADVHWFVANKDLITSWTAILAVIASAVSLVIASISMKMQRAHYRKTVLPLGSLSLGDYENHIFVRLRNDGVGPMILEEISVHSLVDDQRVGSALIDLMPEIPEGLRWASFVKDISGRVFAPGKDIDLLSIKGNENDLEFVDARRRIREALLKLSVKVNYRSIYGDTSFTQRSLDWFGRHLATHGAVE
jgi:hypothetical protein